MEKFYVNECEDRYYPIEFLTLVRPVGNETEVSNHVSAIIEDVKGDD
jgi:hypothetical protein